jgi:hypothetical protein
MFNVRAAFTFPQTGLIFRRADSKGRRFQRWLFLGLSLPPEPLMI